MPETRPLYVDLKSCYGQQKCINFIICTDEIPLITSNQILSRKIQYSRGKTLKKHLKWKKGI